MDDEIQGMTTLISMLDKVLIFVDNEDKRLWSPDSKGQFLLRSFYDVSIGEKRGVLSWKFYWNKLVPPRVVVFCWVGRV